jgi:DeoR/GlpR family transcriptional regulator of sugar metabolism
MLKAARHRRILEMLQNDGQLTIAGLCKQLDVSEMTVRRDLTELEQSGLLRRVHGGAIPDLGRSYEPPYRLRTTRNIAEKQAIGRKAAEMVFDGDSIALDVGTTTFEVARALAGKRNLTIVTASLHIANEIVSTFALDSAVRLIMTGGIVRVGELSMIGHIAERTYRELHVDKAFIGVGALSLKAGLTEFSLEDALVKRGLLDSARQKIGVVDSSKFDRVSFAPVCPLSCLDTIITDASAPSYMLEALQELGIEVIVA